MTPSTRFLGSASLVPLAVASFGCASTGGGGGAGPGPVVLVAGLRTDGR